MFNKTQTNQATMVRRLGISFHTATNSSPSTERGAKKKAQSAHLTPKPNHRTGQGAAFFLVTMSRRSLLATHLVVIILSFVAGRILRATFLSLYSLPPPRHGGASMNLPEIRPTRKIPTTEYSFMHGFDDITAASDSVFILQHPETCSINSEGQQVCRQGGEGDWDAPPPSAEHLLVDLENVDYAFLNSEERLAEAMLQVVNASNISLLSYHCHRLDPCGVSCVGVSLGQHVSFHTWPEAGVITLDLFSTESGSLLYILPVFKDVFGVPSTGMASVGMKWVFKPRGFGQRKPTSSLTVQRSTLDESSENWYDKTLDLTMQDDFQTDHAYYEALVHPVLTISQQPLRVAVIGGGYGAVLREVLKHNYVEEVVIVDANEELVDFSHEHIHDRHYCGDLKGRPELCYADPRVRFEYENPIVWAVDMYLDNTVLWSDDLFDVILIDNPDTDFFEALHSSTDLTESLFNALSAQGILVMPLKESNGGLNGTPWNYVHDGQTADMFSHLAKAGFEVALTYTDSSSVRGGKSQQFLAAFVDYSDRAAWFLNEAEVHWRIRERVVSTTDGALPFQHFDAATMMSYKFPTRIDEETYCQQDSKPNECGNGHGFDPFLPNRCTSDMLVKSSEIGENVGLGVFTGTAIAKDSYVGLGSCVRNMFLPPSTSHLFAQCEELDLDKWARFGGYIWLYAWKDFYYGTVSIAVDCDVLTFANHGCSGSFNIGAPNVTEQDIGDDGSIDDSHRLDVPGKMYRPWSDRHYPMPGCSRFKARRDIQQGEEILDNYLTYGGTRFAEDLASMAQQLRYGCLGWDNSEI